MTLIKRMVSAQTRLNSILDNVDTTLSEMKVSSVLTEIRDALNARTSTSEPFSFLLPDDVNQMLLDADREIGTGNGKLELSAEAPGNHAGAVKIVETLRDAGVNDLTLGTRYQCGCIDGVNTPEGFRFS